MRQHKTCTRLRAAACVIIALHSFYHSHKSGSAEPHKMATSESLALRTPHGEMETGEPRELLT